MTLIGLFVIAGIEIVLGAAVLSRAPRRSTNRWFAGLAAVLAAWGVVNGAFRLVSDLWLNLILARAAFATAALIPVTFFRFAEVFPRPTPSRSATMQAITLVGLFLCGLAFSPWVVTEVRIQGNHFRLLYGSIHAVFAVYFVTCFAAGLFHLSSKLRHAKGADRLQLQYLYLGATLASAGGITTNLLVPLLFGSSRFNVYGPYFTLIWVAFTAHAIVRHRLMDIRVVVSRSVAYATGWVLIAGILVGGGVLASTLMGRGVSPVASVVLGLSSAVLFVLLAPSIKRLADRYLYRPAYHGGQLVREGSRAMATFGDPERVAGAMAELIGRALRPERLAIAEWNPEHEAFHPIFAEQPETQAAPVSATLTGSSALVRELRDLPGVLLADDLAPRPPSPEVTATLADLRAWGAEVAVPVRREGELIAVVLAGPKRSGDPYFREDLDVLETLAAQLAIGLENARLYREIVSIKEYNERILARMDSGVIAVREDGVLTTFNPAAERITGVPATAVLGQGLGALDPALQRLLTDSLAGRPDSEAEIGVAHPDGRTLPLVTHASALFDRPGHIRGAIVVFNDHSRLKALEEDKRRADRLAAIGSLAAGIAHEIRNPLVAIKTFAELLPERADDPEFRSTFAKVASKEIRRIEELLSELRALAVPAVARLQPLDLHGPIADTLDLLRGEADRRRIHVVTDIEPELPAILGEPGQLKQLLLNLVLNGFEAMPSGGTLSVSVRADRDRRGSRLPGPPAAGTSGIVTVRVTDTGPGIPREDLTRIFEPFFTTKAHGTGLGLAICRGIADAHRAALWAEAGPAGAGTAFVIQFPALAGVPLAEIAR